MNQRMSLTLTPFLSPLINLSIFTFFLLARKAVCVDPQFQACKVPKTCGDGQEIRFPFYFQHEQEPYCGYPGFMLSCNNRGNPVLKLSDNEYIVRQIFYNNQSLRVSNAAVLDSNSSCMPSIQNLSLPRDRFQLLSNQMLFLFRNCNLSGAISLSRYRIGCADDNETDSTLVLHENDPILGNASKECKNGVVAPVDSPGGGIHGEALQVLKNGFFLKWVASPCNICEDTGGKCGFNMTTYVFRCFCPDRPHASHCTSPDVINWRLKITIGAATTGIGILITSVIIYGFRKKIASTCFMQITKTDQDIEAFFRNNGILLLKRYSFLEVKKMTTSFKHKLGQGGYGSVYKGTLKDGRVVAVKVLNTSKGNGQEFINEVASISRTSHVNVVTLLGFCLEGVKRALIYEFMPNGSLEKFIQKEDHLELAQHLGMESLLQISIGIAKGLEYLHRGCNTRIVHFDIKPHNILLDEEFCPKISDFGLAKLCTKKESVVSMLEARGTIGYIAPEVFSRSFGAVSHKSDVYSYGMMILEMAGGSKRVDVGEGNSSDIYFPRWIYRQLELGSGFQLHSSMSRDESETARKMIIVGLWCIQTNPSDRPAMSEVSEMLQGSIEALQIPPKPFLSSPPRAPASAGSLSGSMTTTLSLSYN